MLSLFRSLIIIHLIIQLTANDNYSGYPHVQVKPEVEYSDPAGQRLVLKFDSQGRHFEYRLLRKDGLFSPEYRQEISQEHQSGVNLDCYYIEDPQYRTGQAGLSVCDGQVDGVVDGNEIHYDDSTGSHNFYTNVAVAPTECICLAKALGSMNKLTPGDGQARGTPTIELVFVNDYELFTKYFSRDRKKLQKYNRHLALQASLLYAKVGYNVVLAGSIIWDTQEYIGRQQSATIWGGRYAKPIEVHLDRFTKFAYANYYGKRQYDVIHLLTGYTYGNMNQGRFVLGIAYPAQVCKQYATGVFQYSGDDRMPIHQRQMSQTISHEMAHNLGQSHVNVRDPACQCNGPAGRCIMNPYASDSQEWSECTKDYLSRLTTSKEGWCLHVQGLPATVMAAQQQYGNLQPGSYLELDIEYDPGPLVIAPLRLQDNSTDSKTTSSLGKSVTAHN
ncbi:Snake venom metalloproteinase lebetase-4 [Halotydeus destructor]|nr:Snake venom metalloproteinase lebetase-4 [Halotydeus destructor]